MPGAERAEITVEQVLRELKAPAEVYQESYTQTHQHFIQSLRSGEPAENEARDNLKTFAATLAAVRKGQAQPLDFYEAHLSWPGHDVVGAHWAGVPGTQFGFNGAIAWGLTNNAASTRDLYAETLHPDDPSCYRDGETWRHFDERTERIAHRADPAVENVRANRAHPRGGPAFGLHSRSGPHGDCLPPGRR